MPVLPCLMGNEQVEFGKRLRAALKAAGMGESGKQLADLVVEHGGDAVTVQAAHSWIRGKAMPRPANLKALARGLSTRPEVLYGELGDGKRIAEAKKVWQTLNLRDQRTIDGFLTLPAKQRELVGALVAELVDKNSVKSGRG